MCPIGADVGHDVDARSANHGDEVRACGALGLAADGVPGEQAGKDAQEHGEQRGRERLVSLEDGQQEHDGEQPPARARDARAL